MNNKTSGSIWSKQTWKEAPYLGICMVIWLICGITHIIAKDIGTSWCYIPLIPQLVAAIISLIFVIIKKHYHLLLLVIASAAFPIASILAKSADGNKIALIFLTILFVVSCINTKKMYADD